MDIELRGAVATEILDTGRPAPSGKLAAGAGGETCLRGCLTWAKWFITTR
jgi:hypothetical protein